MFLVPEYEQAGREFFARAVQALMRSKDPVLGMSKFETVQELPQGRITTADGQTVDTAPLAFESQFSLSVHDMLAGRFDDLYVAINDAAESGLTSLMPQLFAQLGEVLDATGQAIDAGGQPLSQDHLLDLIQRVDIEFNDDGSPNMPTLVMHPDMAERLRQLPPATPEQAQRFKDIIDQKRTEYLARRRTRRLPRNAD